MNKGVSLQFLIICFLHLHGGFMRFFSIYVAKLHVLVIVQVLFQMSILFRFHVYGFSDIHRIQKFTGVILLFSFLQYFFNCSEIFSELQLYGVMVQTAVAGHIRAGCSLYFNQLWLSLTVSIVVKMNFFIRNARYTLSPANHLPILISYINYLYFCRLYINIIQYIPINYILHIIKYTY